MVCDLLDLYVAGLLMLYFVFAFVLFVLVLRLAFTLCATCCFCPSHHYTKTCTQIHFAISALVPIMVGRKSNEDKPTIWQ